VPVGTGRVPVPGTVCAAAHQLEVRDCQGLWSGTRDQGPAPGLAQAGASPWSLSHHRSRPCSRGRVSVCVSGCTCTWVCASVFVCAFMPESMRARVLERTLPPKPHARNISGCMLHRSQPVATASSPAPPGTAARGCGFVCLLPRHSGALWTALPLWARGTLRVLHAARRLRI
jgi:hypothetical protein